MGELAGNTFGNDTVYRVSGERGPQELAAFSAVCALVSSAGASVAFLGSDPPRGT